MSAPGLPQSLKTNPQLDRWVRFNADRTVTVYSGKVELGQGIVTAIAQIAAEELDVSLARLAIVPGDTRCSPDEWYTAGSQSIEVGGAAMRLACAEVRLLFIEEAARRFEVSAAELRVRDGAIGLPGTDLATSYWDLAGEVSLARAATGRAPPKPCVEHAIVGKSAPRRDIRAKISGAAFVHDMELPGMVYGRVLRPPAQGASLKSLDQDAIRSLPGVVGLCVSGSFVAIAATREEQVVAALEAARAAAQWHAAPALPEPGEISAVLPALPSTRSITSAKQIAGPDAVVTWREAIYSKPYIAHASIGLSCALAEFKDGKLTVWSHTQGPHHLRAQVARVLGIAQSEVEVVHRDGAGCYGHNGADDVALDAALLACACGRPVLLQWTREDELAWSPCGSAMVVKLRAGLDARQRIVEWQHEIWSHTHLKRPGWGEGVNLLAAWHMDPPFAIPPAKDAPLPTGGADRNAVPLYDFPTHEVAYNFIADMPLRVSALRTLGAYANIFAIECFLDELAAASGVDSIAFRLQHLRDARACAVIETAAAVAGWKAGTAGDSARGMGIGFARYKNLSAYCAVIVEIEVAEKIRVIRAVAAVDAGQIVNPDGLKNQIEGGIVQAISWTLKEALRWDRERVTTRSWEDYPILGFDEVPQIEVVLIDHPELPGLGVGECVAGPTAAAIGNALWHALGVRARDLPFTPERVARAMS